MVITDGVEYNFRVRAVNEHGYGIYGLANDVLVERSDHHSTGVARFEEKAGDYDPRGQGLASSSLGDWVCLDRWPGPYEEESFVTAFVRDSKGLMYPATLKWAEADKSGAVTWTAPASATIYSFGLADKNNTIMESKIASQVLSAGDVYSISFNINNSVS